MPLVAGDWEDLIGNRFIAEQRGYDPVQECQKAAQDVARMNQGQKAAHDQILGSALTRDAQGKPRGNFFFVADSGGVRKSFTWNTLIHSSRGHRVIVLSVPSSAMAALILIDGWTAHSMLGIPIPINAASFSHIKKNSEKADMLRQTSLIIWDEAAMQSRLP